MILYAKNLIQKKDSSFDVKDFENFILIIVNFINEFNYLINYTNNQLSVISYTYNLSVNIIKYNINGYWDSVGRKFKQSDVLKLIKKMKHHVVIINLVF